jgi:type I restriction enzyme S subunit
VNDGDGNGALPEGWAATTMGVVAQVVGGGTPKTTVPGNFSDEGGHAWLTPSDLTGYRNKYVSRGRRNLTDQGLASSSAKYMPAGTILFSSRAPIGYVAIATNPITTNQGFRSFVPSDALDSGYAFHYLKSITALAEQLATGTTFNELSGSKAKTLPLPLPPLAEQQRITECLDKIDARRVASADHLHAARVIAGRLRSAVLAAACAGRLTADWRDSNPDVPSVEAALSNVMQKSRRKPAAPVVDLALPDLPESYLVSTIGAASDRLEYGTSRRADSAGEVPVLRMGNIQAGRLDIRELKYLSADAETVALTLEDGDILFNRTNSPELVGKSAVFHEAEPMTFASYLIRVRLAREVADPDFANYWLNSSWGHHWAQRVKTDGVSQSARSWRGCPFRFRRSKSSARSCGARTRCWRLHTALAPKSRALARRSIGSPALLSARRSAASLY